MSNSSFSRSLPKRPSFEHLKKQAKSLLIDYQAADEKVVGLVAHFERQPNPSAFRLQDAQRVLARSYGFSSWTRLKERVIVEAIKNGDRAALESMFKTAADREKLLATKIADPLSTNHAIGKDATLLQFSSFRRWNGEMMATTLLEHGATIDLHSACGLGNVEVISEILQNNPDEVNRQVDTYFPVQYSISAGQVESIRCLMQNGDDPNRDLKKVAYFAWEDNVIDQEVTPWKPIHMASLYGFDATRVPVAEVLRDSGADLNAVSPLSGYRSIHLVAMPGRVDMIRFFVASGVDVDSRTSECRTFALQDEAAGPIENSFENTPLMIACGEGFPEAASCLIELGADVNARNSKGQTPLHIAAQKFWKGQDYDTIIEMLIAQGADTKARDDDGNKPLV